MRRITKIVIVLIADAIVISVPIYYTYYFKYITASTEQVVLNETDLTGWGLVNQSYSLSTDLADQGMEETSWRQMFNASFENGTMLEIYLIAFDSRDAAHQYFVFDSQGWSSVGVKNAEQTRWSDGITRIQVNQSTVVPYLFNTYVLSSENVVVKMGFQSNTTLSEVPSNYAAAESFNSIVVMQMDKISEFHIL